MNTKVTEGARFGKLLVESSDGRNDKGRAVWRCRCDCGNAVSVIQNSLVTGNTKSCGCLQREVCSERLLKHGHAAGGRKSKLYLVWSEMIQRCTSHGSVKYGSYGGRGISVCERWRNSFADFLSDMGEPADGMTLDRIDNNGNYEPANCRWATRHQQARNTRRTRAVNWRGESMCVADWAKRIGVSYMTLYSRLFQLKWPVGRALGFQDHE